MDGWLEPDQAEPAPLHRLGRRLPAIALAAIGALVAGAAPAAGAASQPTEPMRAVQVGGVLASGALTPHMVLGAAASGQLDRWLLVRAGPPIGDVPIDVLRSRDRGRTWVETPVTVVSGVVLEKFAFSDSLHGILVIGLRHSLNNRDTYQTADGGGHWSLTP